MDQDFRARELFLQRLLNPVHAVMRLLDGPVGRDPDVELSEMMGAAGPCPEIVEAGKFRIILAGAEEALPVCLRPFPVHQLVDGNG